MIYHKLTARALQLFLYTARVFEDMGVLNQKPIQIDFGLLEDL
jgi:hypothetical protein